MRRERLIFFIMLLFCLSGFAFGIYYGDEINIYIRNNVVVSDKSIGGFINSFLNFYYDSAKLQILIFLCSYTVFSAPVGAFIMLYGSAALGSSAIVMTDFNSQSGYTLYLSVLLYTFTGAVSLYLYVEMINHGYKYSVSARHISDLGKLTFSRETRSFISKIFIISILILVAEICRFFIITIFF